MSGHSKWNNIKRKKEATDAQLSLVNFCPVSELQQLVRPVQVLPLYQHQDQSQTVRMTEAHDTVSKSASMKMKPFS